MSNLNLNELIIGGHVASDVELRTTPSGVSVTKFKVAVNGEKNDKGEVQTDFFNCTAWQKTAEFFTQYFRKGSSICLRGEIHFRSWVDDKGVKRTGAEVTAQKIWFVDAKGDAAGQQIPGGQYVPQGYMTPVGNSGTPAYTAPGNAPKFEELSANDELPL